MELRLGATVQLDATDVKVDAGAQPATGVVRGTGVERIRPRHGPAGGSCAHMCSRVSAVASYFWASA